MFELIALVASGVAAVFGHVGSRDYTGRKLRYTWVGENPGASGVIAGVGVALLAAPVVAILPIVGAGTALALGAGVGTGVALGAGKSDRS
jgi:hypothetical protein